MDNLYNLIIESNIKKLSLKYNRLSYEELRILHQKKELICQPDTIKRRFGGLKNILSKYNIELYKKEHYNKEIKYNKEKIINIISKLPKDKKYNASVFNKLYKDKIIPFPYHFIDRHLGHIQEACKICGLEYEPYKHGSHIKGKTIYEVYSTEKVKGMIEKLNKHKIYTKYSYGVGRNEKKILDYIQRKSNIKIRRGMWVYIDNKKIYRVDGYIKEINLCIEVDEKHHFCNYEKNKDNIREKNIINFLNCKFIRVDECKWLKNKYYRYYIINEINNILKKVENTWQLV